jgi:hypothetical protein
MPNEIDAVNRHAVASRKSTVRRRQSARTMRTRQAPSDCGTRWASGAGAKTT